MAVDVGLLTRVPDGLSSSDAVAASVPGALAIALLHWAEPREGDTVLVEGGSGNVGGYLVRHARDFGAGRVVATGGTGAGRERTRALGADVVLDHSDPKWTDELRDEGIDIAFDLVGGDVAGRVLDAPRPGSGRMLLYGTVSGHPAVLDAATVAGRGLRITGCGGPTWFRQVFDVHNPEFLDLPARGATHHQPVDSVLPPADAAEAHRRLDSGAHTGRILLVP